MLPSLPATTRSDGTHGPDRSSRTQRAVVAGFCVIGVALFTWRSWDRLTNPGIWAEDGTVFYLQDQLLGLRAVFTEYAGYLHLLCRIPAALVGPFGLTAVPAAYTVISTMLTLLIFATALSPRLEGVLPTVYGRGVTFLGLCALPAMQEAGANVANLIFVGGVGILLLGLARQPLTRAGRLSELGALLVLGLSGPLIVFFSPLFAWRWFSERTRHNLLVVGVAAATAATQLTIYLFSEREAGGHGGLWELFRLYLQRVVGEWLTGPYAALNSWNDSGYIIAISIAWLSVVVVAALWFIRMRALLTLVVTIAATTGAALTYGDLLWFPWALDRHLLVPMSALLVLAVGSVDQAVRWARTGRSLRRGVSAVLGALALGACGMAVSGVTSHFFLDRYQHVPTEADLAEFQDCLDEGDRRCTVPIAPLPFQIGPVVR